jgi:RNA polymerase sigma-54 factor
MDAFQPKLGLKLQTRLVLTPALLQLTRLLALNQLELRDLLTEELTANPVLEEVSAPGGEQEDVDGLEEKNLLDDFDPRAMIEHFLAPDNGAFRERETGEAPDYERFVAAPVRLADHLHWQLGVSGADERQREIAALIIGNLDDDGYLRVSLEELATAGGCSVAEVEQALHLVQQFDPPGVAARDVRECLLLQLEVLNGDHSLAHRIVAEHLDLLEHRRLRELARALGCSLQEVEQAVEVIRHLDPYPGLRYPGATPRVVIPDVWFRKTGSRWWVETTDDFLPQVRISPLYRHLLAAGEAEREVRSYVRERMASALQLLRNLEQRRHIILQVCEVIIERQRECLENGFDYLRPMMIKEVAEHIGVHPATVSRAVANKYARTPHGIFELRSFFSEAVKGPQGGQVALASLKRRVRKMIEDEDPRHPLTDEEIARRLAEQGIQVTRRTVAKYREDLGIPSTHRRRQRS